jgi:WhiB family redox-sensing transcriptional regulator
MMEAIKERFVKVLSQEEQLEIAQTTADWLVPYLYGVEVDAEREVSLLAKARVSEIVGIRDTAQQLIQLKELFASLPPEHKNNTVLYCVGYPQDALSVLAEGDIRVTVDLLINEGELYRPKQTREKVRPAIARPVVVERPLPIEPKLPKTSTVTPPALIAKRAVALSMGTQSDTFYYETQLDWQSDALCAQTDPEAFFPEKGGSTRDAKKICTSCDVKEQCLEYALGSDERFGIWGGKSERERRKLSSKISASK